MGRQLSLAVGTLVLDGGLATELEARGHDLSDSLWSARLLRDDPSVIEAVHLAYYRAGAQVATTASYQASAEGFARAGIGASEAAALLGRSVALARRARARRAAEAAPGEADGLLVAASLGPYGAMLADGQEYEGAYGRTRAELAAFHRPRVAALAAAGPDLLAVETLPGVLEAEAVADILAEFPSLPAWVSFTCQDGARTREGEPIEAAVRAAAASPQVVAVGVNCTAPEHVAELLRRARTATALPLAAYPNDGRVWDGPARRWIGLGVDGFPAATVQAWQDAGAQLIGGCCGLGPAAIAELAAQLAAAQAGRS